MLDVGHTSSTMPASARCASSAGSAAADVPWPIRSAPSSADGVPDRLGTGGLARVRHRRSPAARAASKCGWNCGRGTPISGPPSPNPTRRVGRVVERVGQRRLRGREPALTRDVVDPAQHQPEVALGGHPGVLDRLGVGLDRHALVIGSTEVYGVHVSSAYRTRCASAISRADLVGQNPHVLRRAHQVDDRQVDLDEVGEVAELEELAQLRQVARARAPGVALGQLARPSAATRTRRGGRAARPSADRRRSR